MLIRLIVWRLVYLPKGDICLSMIHFIPQFVNYRPPCPARLVKVDNAKPKYLMGKSALWNPKLYFDFSLYPWIFFDEEDFRFFCVDSLSCSLLKCLQGFSKISSFPYTNFLCQEGAVYKLGMNLSWSFLNCLQGFLKFLTPLTLPLTRGYCLQTGHELQVLFLKRWQHPQGDPPSWLGIDSCLKPPWHWWSEREKGDTPSFNP